MLSRYAALVIGSAHKLLVSLVLLSSASLVSCDTFRGSLVAMTITWPFYPPACGTTNPPGCQPVPQPLFLPNRSQRIEMWGRFPPNEIRRLVADVGTAPESTFTGFSIVPVVDPNDPCLMRAMDLDDQECGSCRYDFEKKVVTGCAIDNSICGAPSFSKKSSTGPGVSDNDATLIQQQLVLQGRKITSLTTPFLAVDAMTTGGALAPLLTLVQWNADANDPHNYPALALTAANAVDPTLVGQRLSTCLAYRDSRASDRSSANPYFYVGNPHQVTKPLSGVQFGFLAFATGPSPGSLTPNLPAQNFNGMSFFLPYAVDDITEILITLESTRSDPPKVPTYGLPNSIPLFSAKRMPESLGGRGSIRMVVFANTTPPLAPGPIPAPTYSVPVGTMSILSSLDSGLN